MDIHIHGKPGNLKKTQLKTRSLNKNVNAFV